MRPATAESLRRADARDRLYENTVIMSSLPKPKPAQPLPSHPGAATATATATSGPPQTRLLDQVRERVRYQHYSIRTEVAYVHWVLAFVRFHGLRHPIRGLTPGKKNLYKSSEHGVGSAV